MDNSLIYEIIAIFILLLLILLFFFLKKTSSKREQKRIEKEIQNRAKRKAEMLSALSDDEKDAMISLKMKERTAFINNLEKEYSAAFHPFNDFVYKTGNKETDALVTKSIGYYKLPENTDKIAAFFFEGDLEWDKIYSITININGMVNRRFEGFDEYMSAHYFDVKSNDLITIEIEFDASSDFTLKNFGILVLKRK